MEMLGKLEHKFNQNFDIEAVKPCNIREIISTNEMRIENRNPVRLS